jgi:outer membrane protein insertion porin family
MKFSLFFALAVLVNLVPEATAQTVPPVVVVPCLNEASSSPTLRRRQIKPDDQPEREQTAALANANPCDNPSATSIGAMPGRPATIGFDGLTAVAESDVRKVLRERGVNRALDSAITSESLADAEVVLKSLLSDNGHRQAAVSSRVDQRTNESPVVTFVISEGPRFNISEIRFEGNRVFSEELLASEVNGCLAKHDKDRRNVYRSELFDYCMHLLANFERSQGYLQARFGEPRIEEVGEELIITISSNEGVLYRLGRVEIEGADHVAEQDVRAMMDIRAGDVVNGEKLAKALYEDLKAVYGEKGFIQYTAEIQPTFHNTPEASEGIVDFMVTVDEGRRFRIRKLAFKGENLPEHELRQMLLQGDGDVYNQKLFEQGVSRINETGLFEWVDKDKDVDYRTNEELDFVDVVIKLTRRTPRN